MLYSNIALKIGKKGERKEMIEKVVSASQEVKKTPKEWCAELGLTIVSPDGWRTSTAPSMDKPISLDEFRTRAYYSTIIGNLNF